MELSEVIRYNITTEKSVALQHTQRQGKRHVGEEFPRYTFRVALEANKNQIREAIEQLFKVKVAKVNTVRMPGKSRSMRTRKGVIRSHARPWKKAIVTLAQGQTLPELQA